MANKGVSIKASKTVKIDEWHGYLSILQIHYY